MTQSNTIETLDMSKMSAVKGGNDVPGGVIIVIDPMVKDSSVT